MARLRNEWEKQQNQQANPPSNDRRNVASKAWDFVNILDSGRSWTTAEPEEDERKKGWKEQSKDAAKSMGSSYDRVSKGAAEVLAFDSKDSKNARNAEDSFMATTTNTLNNLGRELEKTTDKKKRERLTKAIKALGGDIADTSKKSSDRSKEIQERTDPVKGAAAVGSIGFDILTAGAGGNAAKATKEAAKRTISRMASTGGEAALSGAVYGGLGLHLVGLRP